MRAIDLSSNQDCALKFITIQSADKNDFSVYLMAYELAAHF